MTPPANPALTQPPANPPRPPRPPVASRGPASRCPGYYVSRTLQALELLAFHDLSCPQLAASMNVHPRTARRLVARLADDGYVEQTSDTRHRYRATLRLAALGAQLVTQHSVSRTAVAHIAGLHRRTACTAHLMIPSYRHVACVVHCDRPPDDNELTPTLRELLPAQASAAGTVLLAHRQPWRDSFLTTPFPDPTHSTTSATRDVAECDAAQTRVRGYAIHRGEHHLSIAAPVHAKHTAVAAIAITLTATTGQEEERIDALVAHVTYTAATLTEALTQPREQRRPQP